MQNISRPLAEQVLRIARTAGDAILRVYRGDAQLRYKSDASPLTAADLASHRVIAQGLGELNTAVPLLSEEGAHIAYATRREWPRYWLVDPLDGTREFVKRNGEFTVNIALIERGVAVLGVVHAPVTDTSYIGLSGIGAWKSVADGPWQAITVAKVHETPVRVVASRSHAGDSLKGFLARVGSHAVVPMGSSLKLCLVAEGMADVYPRFGPTSEWDTAAAQAVVEAAGGRVTDTGLQTLRYNDKESLLNPPFLVFGDVNENWARYL
ncbi:MAG: 3'(2'),5'-bisphosphate nucleotidase CysQ [Gammaproteobacteria bacterium]|nr:3'(2'),5'-bisphosphate nucleotidase CysQ [Gammaproteobacteria bacterium]